MANESKIVFTLDPADEQGYKTEGVWAEQLTDKTFRITNIPFFAFGVSYQDEVEAEPEGEVFRFVKVIRRGGHSTYRIFLRDDRTIQSPDFIARWEQLRNFGCRYENANGYWVAVDVPPSSDARLIYGLLQEGEELGIWAFEEGDYAEKTD